jgi:hypothetical protein
MSTGVPSLTTSFSAGIWLEIFLAGSVTCGDAWPSVRFFWRSTFSASATVRPTIFGTLTLPVPMATRIVTSESFLAFSPPAGVWPITVPGGWSLVTLTFCWEASLRFALVSCFSASNADLVPTTSGTTTFLGMSRSRKAISAASSSTIGTSHHGSHGFWRRMPWEGMSGICGAAAPPPPLRLSMLGLRLCWPIWGPCICGPENWGLEMLIPPGPKEMLGW